MTEIAISLLDVEEEDAVSYFYNVETAKINYFHLDVNDGKFVDNNNIKKMKDFALKINTVCMTPREVHLMTENPREYFYYFIDQGADRIIFHLEACKDKEEILNNIKYLNENGIKAGIAISPDTSIEKVYDYLPYIHMVLLMSVIPGRGGQKFIPEVLRKIEKLKNYCVDNDFDIDIEVDGGINNITCRDAVSSGATILVAGKYILNSDNYAEAVRSLREEYIEEEKE